MEAKKNWISGDKREIGRKPSRVGEKEKIGHGK